MHLKKVIMLGATGAVGNQTALQLSKIPQLGQLTLLGRNQANNIVGEVIQQHQVDVFKPDSYCSLLQGHEIAICTLGVGQPSKMSKQAFVKIDKTAVLDFAIACKTAGITHFQLLSSVGASAASRSFYLRSKGELEDALKALNFERLSLFQPSMIITPKNRYGLSQAVVLKLMPLLDPLLIGSLNKFRSIAVDRLGKAIAFNVFTEQTDQNSCEVLNWAEFITLSMDINKLGNSIVTNQRV